MKEYLDILNYIIENGTVKENRTGVKTLSVFDYHYKIDVQNGFPLLTTKKINWRNILFENLWFLSGNSSNKFFEKHGIKFWKPWEDEKGNLPRAYGEFWRKYPGWDIEPMLIGDYIEKPFDQFSWIVNELKTNPDNRRLCLTNWYPPSARNVKLPPCHCFAVFNVQYTNDGTPELNLHMTQRSVDTMIGLPYNLSGYSFLLELVSHLTNIRPRYFGHNLIDCHIYSTHLKNVVEQLDREPRMLPSLIINDKIKTVKDLDEIIRDGETDEIMGLFKIENYNPHPFIKYDIVV